jgi:hypothetical protein
MRFTNFIQNPLVTLKQCIKNVQAFLQLEFPYQDIQPGHILFEHYNVAASPLDLLARSQLIDCLQIQKETVLELSGDQIVESLLLQLFLFPGESNPGEAGVVIGVGTPFEEVDLSLIVSASSLIYFSI